MKANGHADNHVMLIEDRRWGDSFRSPVLREALRQMDQWLTTLSRGHVQRLGRSRSCGAPSRRTWSMPAGRADETPQQIVEKQRLRIDGPLRDRCIRATRSRAEWLAPRLPSDIIKCQLKPIDPADYKVAFSTAEMAKAQADFPGRRVRLVEAGRRAAALGGYVAGVQGHAWGHPVDRRLRARGARYTGAPMVSAPSRCSARASARLPWARVVPPGDLRDQR